MRLTVFEICNLILAKTDSKNEQLITGFAKIEEADSHELSFLSNPKYEHFLYKTKAGAVLVDDAFVPKQATTATLIYCQNAYQSFAFLMQYTTRSKLDELLGVEEPAFLHPTAHIQPGAYRGFSSYIGAGTMIGKNAKIFPQVFIGQNVTIGNDVVLYAGVKIYDDVQIGDRCVIHAGAIVGSDGFGFAPQADGSYLKIPQTGTVEIENDVEIGANTCIDRATMGKTIIKQGVKLDNLVQVAHNAIVGEHTVMAAQAGIAGSGVLGSRCVVGGQVAIVGHLNIANGTKIGGQSGVTRSVSNENTEINGTPAHGLKENLKSVAIFRKLPEILKRIEDLEKKLKLLAK